MVDDNSTIIVLRQKPSQISRFWRRYWRLKIILFCGKKAGHIPRHADEGEAMGKKLNVGGPATHEEVDAAYQASQELHERERLLAIRMGLQEDWTLEKNAHT